MKKNNRFTVRYKGEKYKTTLKGIIQIGLIKLKLWIKRQYRRFCILFSKNSFMYLIILIAWVIFSIITYIWGRSYKAEAGITYRYLDVLWDLKNPFFSSIILSILINAYNSAADYRKKLNAQYYLYIDTIHAFDSLLYGFLGKRIIHFLPLYNSKCLEDAKKYIHENKTFDKSKISSDAMRCSINALDKLEESITHDRIIGIKHKNDILRTISERKDTLNEYKKFSGISQGSFEILLDDLLFLVALTHFPWIRDIKDDYRILTILNENEKNRISKDFYFSMTLNGGERALQLGNEEKK